MARKHWNWSGVVESDCGAVEGLGPGYHSNVRSKQAAAVRAVNATVDVDCMFPSKNAYSLYLHAAWSQKLVLREQLEAAVARIYRGRFQVSLC